MYVPLAVSSSVLSCFCAGFRYCGGEVPMRLQPGDGAHTAPGFHSCRVPGFAGATRSFQARLRG